MRDGHEQRDTMKPAVLFLLLVLSCSAPPLETGAVLSVISQGVTVNGNVPTVGMLLNVGDIVATTAGAEAAIEFYNGSIVRLRENTSITIKKLTTNKDVVLSQERGQTWNRVTRLAGINTYRVETPNTVATVRGTGFKVTVDFERTWVGVAEGAVNVQRVEDDIVVAETLVQENDQAEIFFDTPEVEHNDIVIEELQTDDWFEENIELDEQYVEDVYTDAGEEVPVEYVEEFAEHTLEETEKVLNESDEHITAAEETLENAEEIAHEIIEENKTETVTDTHDKTTDDSPQEIMHETIDEQPPEETQPLDTTTENPLQDTAPEETPQDSTLINS